MRTFTLDLDTLTQLINGREQQENWLDLESGSVLSLSPEDQHSEQRQHVELNPDRYTQIPNLDIPPARGHARVLSVHPRRSARPPTAQRRVDRP
ncbi:hypothetical protein ACNFCJ_00890 [Pseudomonas sp. NY15364]|uniref:hypothetical protein n=1 Tax=Pseudomonas sp. NY15364 TaxID=3400353 RepID=UPI003A83FC3D